MSSRRRSALLARGAELHYVIRRWTLFGIPLPLSLGPQSRTSEGVEDGQFRFDVEIRHAFMGFIVRYRGVLLPR